MICGSGGSKSRLAKAAGAEPSGQMRDEKLLAVVVQSTFRSQNVQSTPFSDHFWKLRRRKSARRCSAKHISKSKCTKHTSSGPLLEVAMSKKCTPLWHEVHVEVKMHKTHQVRTTFGSWDVEKVHNFVARSTFRSQNVKNTGGSDHIWTFRCRFASQAQGIVDLVKSEQNVRVLKHFQLQPPLHHTTLHYNYNYTFTTFHYTTLHTTTLHSTPLHYTQLKSNYSQVHSITFNYTQLHYATLHYTTLHSTTLHNTPLHSTTFNYTTPQYITLHYSYNYNYTTLIALHHTTLHYTLHDTTRHDTTLH